MIKVYGIKNCQSVQKALNWLDDYKIDYELHNYKMLGIDKARLDKWCQEFGWEKVLNRSGMMWRKASEERKAFVIDQDTAIDFMIEVPNSIKRPILELEDGRLLLGFDTVEYMEAFGV
jgi:arsenate reductase (glutaredoxin)